MNTTMKLSSALIGAALLSVAATSEAFADGSVVVNTNNDESGMMMGLFITPAVVKAGKVTITVNNNSKSIEHEAVVVALKPSEVANPMSLPYDDKVERVPEDKIESMGEVAELEPGKSGSVTLDLKPGVYEVICNVPTHYKAGMHALLTVE